MRRKLILLCSLLPVSLLSFAAPAADHPGPISERALREAEEIIVEGRLSFPEVRQQLHEAEDRMYTLFNDLNGHDRYDIRCKWVQRTGTKIKQRACAPEFYRSAQEDWAQSWLLNLQGSNFGYARVPVQAVVDHEMPKLEQELKDAIQRSPELYDAVMEHYRLREQLAAMQAVYFDD